MQFTSTLFALAALTSSVFAQEATPGFNAISSPSSRNQEIPAGSSFEIKWAPTTFTDSLVTVVLLSGASDTTLVPAGNIASGILNSVGQTTWTVPTTSSAAIYGFRIQLDSDPKIFQYSFPVKITGASSSSSATTTGPVSSGVSSSSTAASVTILSANSTSVAIPTSSTLVISTTAAALNSTTLAPVPSTTAVAGTNSTIVLSSTVGSSRTSGAGAGPTGTGSSPAASVTGNGAVSNMASGGMAVLGGLMLALVL